MKRKMHSRVLAALTGAALLASVCGSLTVTAAGAIRVEGEKYTSASCKIGMAAGNEYSEGAMVTVSAPKADGQEYRVNYTVDIPSDGAYSIEAVTTNLGFLYTTDFSVIANGDTENEVVAVNESTLLQSDVSPTMKGSMSRYTIGTLGLHRGENTITFVCDPGDARGMDGLIIFYMDYFELTPVPFGIRVMETDRPLNVFEQNNSVGYTLRFNSNAPANTELRFVIKDFWAAEVLSSDFKVKEGSRSYKLNFGRFEPGWYTLEVYDGSARMGYSTFSVVAPKSARKKYEDTPFAMDFGSSQLVAGGIDAVKEYIAAAELSGIQWVRERYLWQEIEPQKGQWLLEPLDEDLAPFKNSSLNVLDITHTTPGWARRNGMAGAGLPIDLFDAYNMQKTVAERYNDEVQMWEVWNEEDTAAFLTEPADMYSAYYKASALAIADADTDSLPMMGGVAQSLTSSQIPLMLQNGILDYSVGYNFHYHLSDNGENVHQFVGANRSPIPGAYDDSNKPIWVTEAGMYLPVKTGQPPTREQLLSQARYLVTSTVQSLSAGVDKHFWFVLPSYVEAGRELGSFYATGMPYPCYSAEAAITYVLGKARYKGALDNLPKDAEGYLFDNGERDVAVVWSEHGDDMTFKTDAPVTVYDIMGRSSTVAPTDGKVTIRISNYPVYAAFEGVSDEENYYPQEYIVNKDIKMPEYNEGQHVVMNQIFGERALTSPKISGYRLTVGEETEMTLDVYNFNQKPVTGTVRPVAPKGYVVTPASADLTIDSMTKAQVKFTISFTDEVAANETNFLKFEGEFNGEKTSDSVSRVFAYKEVDPANIVMLEGTDDPDNWDGTNITAGGYSEITKGAEPGSVRYKPTFNGGDKWFYPYFDIPDPSIFYDTTGICWRVYSDKDVAGAKMHFFAYLNDGRQFYSSNAFQIKAGWTQYTIKWDALTLQQSPYGLTDYRPFDLSLVNRISIGMNPNPTANEVQPYEIKDIGYYTEPEKPVTETDIILDGIEEGAHYESGELANVNAALPDVNEYTNVRVVLNDEDMTDFKVSGNDVAIDLSKLKRGRYTMQIAALTKFNYAVRKVVNFYIE